MAFSEIELARIEKAVGGLCTRRTRPALKAELSLEYRVEGHNVTLFERRARWDGKPGFSETPIAKLAFTKTSGKWRLYWMRGNLKWHAYEASSATGDLVELLSDVDSDEFGCFFG